MEEIDLSPLVKRLVEEGFTITKIEDEPNPFDKATEILKEAGYKVERPVQRSMKQDLDKAIADAVEEKNKKAGERESVVFEADKVKKVLESLGKKTETETKTDDKKAEIEQVVKLLGTPTNNEKVETELTEDTILAMTPEQIQEKMPEIRKYILANGGEF